MIVPDVNVLLYAEDSTSEHHPRVRAWWDAQLSGTEPVGLAWVVLAGFIRLSTNPRVLQQPLPLAQALARVQSWLDQPCVRTLHPTEAHWALFQQMLLSGQATGNLVSDAHLAALAVEHNALLCSTDADFARFRGLKWFNPVARK